MAIPIPIEIRRKIIQLRQSGIPYSTIATQLSVSESGAKKIWSRYQREGAAGLSLRYENCGRKPVYDESLRSLVLSFDPQDHGGPYVRSVLQANYPLKRIPHERTIQRWWRSAGKQTVRNRAKPRPAPWSTQTHEVWQIDGKEQIDLQTGERVSWLNIVDEASRAPLQTEAFPLCSDE